MINCTTHYACACIEQDRQRLAEENTRLHAVLKAAEYLLEMYSEDFWRDPEYLLRDAVEAVKGPKK